MLIFQGLIDDYLQDLEHGLPLVKRPGVITWRGSWLEKHLPHELITVIIILFIVKLLLY